MPRPLRSATITLSFAAFGAALNVLGVHAAQPVLRAPALAPANVLSFVILLGSWIFALSLLPRLGRRAWRRAQASVPLAARFSFALPILLASSFVFGAIFDPVLWDFVAAYKANGPRILHALAWLITLVTALLFRASQRLARRFPIFVDRHWPIYLAVAALATAVALPNRLPFSGGEFDPSAFAAAAVEGHRVVLFGVDGADWRTIDALIAEGELPAFARLRKNGLTAPLPTIPGEFSPIIWTTVATGRPSSVHGVLGFYDLHVPRLDLRVPRVSINPLNPILRRISVKKGISNTDWLARPLWSVLSEMDRSLLVVNWFLTAPVEPIGGVMISDRNPFYTGLCDEPSLRAGTIGADWHPQDLFERPEFAQLAEACLETPEYSELLALLNELRPTESLFYARQVRSGEIFARLLKQRPRDVSVYLTRLVDGVSHAYSHGVFAQEKNGTFALKVSEELRDESFASVVLAYRMVDSLLGRVFEDLDENTLLIVVSDHGWDYDGTHHNRNPDGIFAVYGALLAPEARFDVAPTLFDVAPTVVAVSGGALSRELEGRVLSEVFSSPPQPNWVDTYGEHRPDGRAEFDAMENDRNLRELRALGYLE